MGSGLRWRVVSLQVVMVVVFAFIAGFMYWGANFTHSYVHDELVSQKISFPPAGAALLAKDYPNLDVQKWAGQKVTDGVGAEAFAKGYLGQHLLDMGMTYSEASTASRAKPNDPKLAALVQTIFRGETLRGLLLNAWGWWTVGTYALYAAIGMTVASAVVFLAFLYELFVAPKQAPSVVRGRQVAA